MIRPVGINTVNFNGTNLLEKFKEKQNTQPEPAKELTETKGSEAIANYNKAAINTTPAILKDLKPAELVTLKGDEVETLEGEKVYNSYNSLEAIVQKGEKTTREYHFLADKEIGELVEKDNETGKIIKEITFTNKDTQPSSSYIKEFDLQTGMEKTTVFHDGKPSFVVETKNGRERTIGFNEDGSVRLTSEYETSANAQKVTIYKNGKIETIKYFNDDGIVMKSKYAPDNGEVTQYTNEKITVPDFDIQKIKEELKPADINSVKIPQNPQELQGEKRLRSNGTIESIELKEGDKTVEYKFDFDGKKILRGYEKINDKPVRDFSCDYDGNVTSISEVGNGADISTFFGKDGKIEGITLIKDGIYKHLEFAKGSERYNEWNSETKRDVRTVMLDKNGDVISYMKDTPDGYITLKKGLADD